MSWRVVAWHSQVKIARSLPATTHLCQPAHQRKNGLELRERETYLDRRDPRTAFLETLSADPRHCNFVEEVLDTEPLSTLEGSGRWKYRQRCRQVRRRRRGGLTLCESCEGEESGSRSSCEEADGEHFQSGGWGRERTGFLYTGLKRREWRRGTAALLNLRGQNLNR